MAAKSNLPANLQVPAKSGAKKSAAKKSGKKGRKSSRQTTAGVRSKLSGRTAQAKGVAMTIGEIGGTSAAFSAVRGYRGLGDDSLQLKKGTGVLARISDARFILGLAALGHSVWKKSGVNPHSFNVGAGALINLGNQYAEQAGAKLAKVSTVASGQRAESATVTEGLPDGAVVLGSAGDEVGGRRRSGKRIQRLQNRQGRRFKPGRQRRLSRLQGGQGGGDDYGYDGGYGDDDDGDTVIVIRD